MQRRQFLRRTAALGALSLAGTSQASGWGEPHTGLETLLLGPGDRAERMLEVNVYGGMTPLESWYVVDEYGAPDDPERPNTW